MLRALYRDSRAWVLSRDLRPSASYFLSPEERSASSAVSVVIAVHDAPVVTARCISSLEKFGGDAEIVVVDDGSKLDAVREMLDVACSRNRWKLIRHSKAAGHSRASEAGVLASERPYICLLNSNTVITPHSWAGLVGAFESSPRIAVAGPSTSHTFGPQQVTGHAIAVNTGPMSRFGVLRRSILRDTGWNQSLMWSSWVGSPSSYAAPHGTN